MPKFEFSMYSLTVATQTFEADTLEIAQELADKDEWCLKEEVLDTMIVPSKGHAGELKVNKYPQKEEPEFFVKDTSGRSFTNTLNSKEIKDSFKGYTNIDGISISKWIREEPSIGDTWINESIHITRIK